MTASRVTRRVALSTLTMSAPVSALGLPGLLAGCGGRARPVSFAPMGWDYLPRLKLNVAAIDINAAWTSRAGNRERGFLAPTPPVDALRRMAMDRLIPAGASGRAVFIIDDASIVQVRDTYQGVFAVHLDVSTSDGTRSGYAEARVLRTRTIDNDSPDGVRAGLYDMVRQMMTDMNVEFEFQVRHSLRDYLQTTEPAAPEQGPVERQDLAAPTAPPPAAKGAPALEPALAPAPARPPAPAASRQPSAMPFSIPAPTPPVR